MQSIPLLAIPNQELNILLAGQECSIQVRQIGERLYFSLWIDDAAVALNNVILPCVPLLPGGAAGFSGNFMMVDTQAKWEGQGVAQYGGLGDRWRLVYVADEEY